MAEVKVKVTAQNETRTGFQQALNDAKQFGNEATRSVTIDDDAALAPLRKIQQQLRDVQAQARAPIEPGSTASADDGLASTSVRGAAAIRGLAADLANATSPAQVFEAVIKRISTAFGGLIAVTAGFAIGSLIRRSLDDAAAGLNNLIDRGETLSQTLSSLTAPTTSFEQFASTLSGVRAQIEELQKATEAYKSSFSNIAVDFATQGGSIRDILANAVVPGGVITSRIIDRLRGEQGALFDQADANQQSKIDEARLSIRAAIAQQLQNEIALSQQTTEEGRRQLGIEQQRAKQRKELQGLLNDVGATPQERDQRLTEFDRLTSQIQNREPTRESGTRRGDVTGRQLGPGDFQGLREFERAQEAARRSLGPEFGPGTADAAAGGFRVDAARFSQQQQEEALRLAQQQISQLGAPGSAGASSLQRIGFASNEFFDTRNKKDPAEAIQAGNKILQDIKRALESGQPLVLSSNS